MGVVREWRQDSNPDSVHVDDILFELSLAGAKVADHFPFEKTSFFAVDPDSQNRHLVFNRTFRLKSRE
jgi:hypothetical protein